MLQCLPFVCKFLNIFFLIQKPRIYFSLQKCVIKQLCKTLYYNTYEGGTKQFHAILINDVTCIRLLIMCTRHFLENPWKEFGSVYILGIFKKFKSRGIRYHSEFSIHEVKLYTK